MKQLKLKDILLLNDTLKTIINDNNLKIDVVFKFKLLGILNSISNDVDNFDKIRNEKIVEYGVKDEETNNVKIMPGMENWNKFSDDISSLLENDVEIKFNCIKADDAFNSGLTADYLNALYHIIKM